MFDIFSIVVFVIIIYFIMQKYNYQEKFEDIAPIPGGTWRKSCHKYNASWIKNDDSTYTLTTICKNKSGKYINTSINLKNDVVDAVKLTNNDGNLQIQ